MRKAFSASLLYLYSNINRRTIPIRLIHFFLNSPNLLSHQELRDTLQNCLKLEILDIRDNQFEGELKDLINILLSSVPALKHIFVERSLKKKLGVPKDYVANVFSIMPSNDFEFKQHKDWAQNIYSMIIIFPSLME